METPTSYDFSGARPGPHLLILGSIHGNEVCGTTALARLKLELDLGLTTLACGRLTIVPVCNPAAYRAGKRFIDVNLNRIIKRWENPKLLEEHYANQLAALIEAADIVLDLHSYSAGTIPYVFLDYPTPENMGFAQSLGLQHCLTGWPELNQQAPDLSEGDTILHAHRAGKRGALVECGAHDDPASLAIAAKVVKHALAYCGMIEGTGMLQTLAMWRVESVILRDREGVFSLEWQNLDRVTEGTPLINFADGTTYHAPYDGIVILPNAKVAMGHEWIYFGRSVGKAQ